MPKAMWSYQCEYCGGLFKSYKFCDKHEMACIKNPEGKSCMYCEYGWSKKERRKNNMICPKSKRKYCKQISANCEFFPHSIDFWHSSAILKPTTEKGGTFSCPHAKILRGFPKSRRCHRRNSSRSTLSGAQQTI